MNWKRCVAALVLLLHVVVSAAAEKPQVRAAAADEQGLAVKSVGEVANPCDVNKQRMKKVGGMALGAILGFAACRLATEVVDKDSKTSSKNKKSAACAVIGGIAGYTWSADSARRQCELFNIAQQNKIEATFQEVTIVQPAEPAAPGQAQPQTQKETEAVVAVATLSGLSHFASGSATLTPEARQYFTAMARQYTLEGQQESLQRSMEKEKKNPKSLKQENIDALRKEWAEIRIVLIGHTDDTGTDAINATLSEQRARAVAEVFRGAGIAVDKLYYQGAGSSLPIADNRTEEGRGRNRRVEVIELPPGADVAGYLSLRRPNPAFFRPLPEPKVASVPRVAQPAPARTPPPAKKPAASDEWGEPTAQPSKPVAPPPAKPPVRAAANIDFGGQAAKPRNDAIMAAMGPPASRGMWGFVSTAVADEEAIYSVPCTRDSAHLNEGLPVKQLGSGKPVYKTNEYLPGFNDTPWMGSVNGHRVALNHVAILRDGNEPVRNPDLLVYKDFDRTRDAKADLRGETRVKVYEGKQGLLYRVFVPKSYLRCLDVVVPVGGSLEANAGSLYYERGDAIFEAPYVPSRVRAQ